MSRFTKYLKEAMSEDAEAMVEPGASINSQTGNVSTGKGSVLSHTPEVGEEKKEKAVEDFISKYGIRLDQESVETLIALVTKTLNDWNRDKNIDGNEIEAIVHYAIKDGLIEVS